MSSQPLPEPPSAAFADSYAAARAQFLAAAAAAGAAVQSIGHPLPGRDGEALAIDAARLEAGDGARLLVVSSGCHGVEGHAGSGAQVALLRDAAVLQAARAAGVTLLLLHALNPHGFSFGRRVTEDNVDLNRNFVDFSSPLPDNPGYDEIAGRLVPAAWPPAAEQEAALFGLLAQRGAKALQQAVSAGQYRHADGLFYGGRAPTWSQQALRGLLRAQAAGARRIGWIDLHTGLGPPGVGELIFAGADGDRAALARARAWWGEGRITATDDGSSVSAALHGQMLPTVVDDECPQAELTAIGLEFGTVPLLAVVGAMRVEQWLHNHPQDADAGQQAAVRRQLRAAFHSDDEAWQQQVLAQTREAVLQAVGGLAAG